MVSMSKMLITSRSMVSESSTNPGMASDWFLRITVSCAIHFATIILNEASLLGLQMISCLNTTNASTRLMSTASMYRIAATGLSFDTTSVIITTVEESRSMQTIAREEMASVLIRKSMETFSTKMELLVEGPSTSMVYKVLLSTTICSMKIMPVV